MRDYDCIVKQVIESNPVAGKSFRRGRPRKTWRTTVKKEAKLKQIAKNRTISSPPNIFREIEGAPQD